VNRPTITSSARTRKTIAWLRKEIARLDGCCSVAKTKSSVWYCLGNRAGLRAVLKQLSSVN